MGIFEKIRPKAKQETLTVVDTLVVTVIMFGYFIYISTVVLLQNFTTTTATSTQSTDLAQFSSADDWSNLIIQSVFLIIALAYLWLRHFDFRSLKIRFRWFVFPLSILIFALVGLASDLVFTLFGEYNYFSSNVLAYIDWSFGEVFSKISKLYPSIIIYGLFNGFYEEFYFLGVMTSVKEESRLAVFIFSLIVRFSFHTYQGLLPALVIGFVIGIIYYILYRYRVKNLLPFFLAHAYADFFGTSLISLIVIWA